MKAALTTMLLVLVAADAWAQESTLSATEAALLASQVHGEHCADAEAVDPETQALAIERAAPAYGKVAAAYRTHGSGFLLYWRGKLAQCLSKEEQARSDFLAFVEAMEGDPEHRSQVQDARRRIRRLGGAPTPSRTGAGPGAGPGIAVAAAGGGVAAGGLALNLGSYVAADFDAEAGYWNTTQQEYDSSLDLNRMGLGLAVGGGAAAIAGILVAVAVGVGGESRQPVAIGATILATPDRAHVVVGGRW